MNTSKQPLTELETLVYNFVKDAVENKQFHVELDEQFASDTENYISGYLFLKDHPFRVSFNVNGFCCFHSDDCKKVLYLTTKDEQQEFVNAAFHLAKQTMDALKEKLNKEFDDKYAFIKNYIAPNEDDKQ